MTGLDVYNAEELGLPKDAKVLLFNDGKITGRQARLRRLVNDENRNKYADLLREVVFHTRKRKMYHAQVYVGLDKEFMIKAHLLVPEGYENTLYSWMLNFQAVDEEYSKVYQDSILLDEGDIYILPILILLRMNFRMALLYLMRTITLLQFLACVISVNLRKEH